MKGGSASLAILLVADTVFSIVSYYAGNYIPFGIFSFLGGVVLGVLIIDS